MRFVSVLLMLGLTLGACGNGGESSANVPSDSALMDAVGSLCTARDEVTKSIEDGRRVFQDEAHSALHEIARRVTPIDRVVAARLLEAKQRVEAAFETKANPGAMRDFLSRLIEEANLALAELSLSKVGCQ